MENNDKPVVEESAAYENCIGVKVEPENKQKTVFEILGIEDTDTDDKEWKKHWVGMPEFDQEENPTYKSIQIHFRNEDDYNTFAKLIGQNLSMKTKSIWYPKLDRTKNSLLRWIEE